jgi:hypothetical protein
MTTPLLATRIKKARTTGGVCPRCGTTLIQGQSIAKAGSRWLHTLCLVRKQPMIGPHSRA